MGWPMGSWCVTGWPEENQMDVVRYWKNPRLEWANGGRPEDRYIDGLHFRAVGCRKNGRIYTADYNPANLGME